MTTRLRSQGDSKGAADERTPRFLLMPCLSALHDSSCEGRFSFLLDLAAWVPQFVRVLGGIKRDIRPIDMENTRRRPRK